MSHQPQNDEKKTGELLRRLKFITRDKQPVILGEDYSEGLDFDEVIELDHLVERLIAYGVTDDLIDVLRRTAKHKSLDSSAHFALQNEAYPFLEMITNPAIFPFDQWGKGSKNILMNSIATKGDVKGLYIVIKNKYPLFELTSKYTTESSSNKKQYKCYNAFGIMVRSGNKEQVELMLEAEPTSLLNLNGEYVLGEPGKIKDGGTKLCADALSSGRIDILSVIWGLCGEGKTSRIAGHQAKNAATSLCMKFRGGDIDRDEVSKIIGFLCDQGETGKRFLAAIYMATVTLNDSDAMALLAPAIGDSDFDELMRWYFKEPKHSEIQYLIDSSMSNMLINSSLDDGAVYQDFIGRANYDFERIEKSLLNDSQLKSEEGRVLCLISQLHASSLDREAETKRSPRGRVTL